MEGVCVYIYIYIYIYNERRTSFYLEIPSVVGVVYIYIYIDAYIHTYERRTIFYREPKHQYSRYRASTMILYQVFDRISMVTQQQKLLINTVLSKAGFSIAYTEVAPGASIEPYWMDDVDEILSSKVTTLG
jgi:hypothetical protein